MTGSFASQTPTGVVVDFGSDAVAGSCGNDATFGHVENGVRSQELALPDPPGCA